MKRVFEIIREKDFPLNDLICISNEVSDIIEKRELQRSLKRWKSDSTHIYETASENFKKDWFSSAQKVKKSWDKKNEYSARANTKKSALLFELHYRQLQHMEATYLKSYYFDIATCQSTDCYYIKNKDKVDDYRYSKHFYSDPNRICCDKCKLKQLYVGDEIMEKITKEYDEFIKNK